MEQVSLPNADQEIKQLSKSHQGEEIYRQSGSIEPRSAAAFYGCLCHKEFDLPALDSTPMGVYGPDN